MAGVNEVEWQSISVIKKGHAPVHTLVAGILIRLGSAKNAIVSVLFSRGGAIVANEVWCKFKESLSWYLKEQATSYYHSFSKGDSR